MHPPLASGGGVAESRPAEVMRGVCPARFWALERPEPPSLTAVILDNRANTGRI